MFFLFTHILFKKIPQGGTEHKNLIQIFNNFFEKFKLLFSQKVFLNFLWWGDKENKGKLFLIVFMIIILTPTIKKEKKGGKTYFPKYYFCLKKENKIIPPLFFYFLFLEVFENLWGETGKWG